MMRKHLKQILICAVTVALLLTCLPVTAAAADDYDILSDDIRIVISEDHIATITETIVLDYKVPLHGFYYAVQYKGTKWYYVGNEWQDAVYDQSIDDFNVEGYEFELSDERHADGTVYLVAKIGSPDITVTGQQTYVITYQCDLGEDKKAAFDLFFRDLICCAEGYTIENASFTVELPKDFDESMIHLTLELYSPSINDITWEKNGSTITGHALRPMESGETITMRAELPEGYFKSESAALPENSVEPEPSPCVSEPVAAPEGNAEPNSLLELILALLILFTRI